MNSPHLSVSSDEHLLYYLEAIGVHFAGILGEKALSKTAQKYDVALGFPEIQKAVLKIGKVNGRSRGF